MPLSVGSAAGVDGYDHKLAAVASGYVADELRVAHGGTVDGYFVGSGVKQGCRVVERGDASAYGEGDVDTVGYAAYEAGEGAAPFAGGRDVEIHEFVGTLKGVTFSESHGVADIGEAFKVDAFDGAAVLDIQTVYDALG